MWAEGIVTLFHLDTCWDRNLEYFRELPRAPSRRRSPAPRRAGGGFILGSGCSVPSDAKPANFRALIEAGKEQG